jgi:hypothetical protein
VGYIREYYNDKLTFADADPVTVTAPQVLGGIDTTLQQGASITGIVTAEDSGAPLADVEVDAYDCYGFYAGYAYTNASGVYTVTGLVAGDYRVAYFPEDYGVSKAYLPEWYDNRESLPAARSVRANAAQVATGIDAELARGGQISGRVTAADGGAPLDAVGIEIYLPGWDYVGEAETDATGVYTSTALPAGDYVVQFDPDDWDSSREYAQEFYDDKALFDDAVLVHVSVPEITAGIDAVLNLGGKISGRVTDNNGGAGLDGVWVDVYANDTYAYAYSEGGGYYTVRGLPTGSYLVAFYDSNQEYIYECYDDHSGCDQNNPVQVTAPAEVSSINAGLSIGGSIECLVTAQDTGLPLEDVYVAALDSNGNYVYGDWTDVQGHCLLGMLPGGQYRVEFYAAMSYAYEGCFIHRTSYYGEFYNDKPDFATADPVSVTPGASVQIEAVLALEGEWLPLGRGTAFMPMMENNP